MYTYGSDSKEYKKNIEWFSKTLSDLEFLRQKFVAEFNYYLHQHKKSKNNPDIDYKIRDKNVFMVREFQNQLRGLKAATKQIQRDLSNFKRKGITCTHII